MDATRTISIFDSVVELGVIRMPTGVRDETGKPFYPRMALAVDAASGMIVKFEMSEPGDDAATLAESLLHSIVEQMNGLPKQILVRDLAVARALRNVLAGDPINVVTVRESLPMLDEAFETFGEFKGLGPRTSKPGLLDEPGMSLERLIAFAEAAREFYLARPWQHLMDDDLIEIASPKGPKATRCTQVLGAAGQVFGLGFVASVEAHIELSRNQTIPHGGMWSLQFGDLDSIPFADGETWEKHRLPLVDPEAYPALLKYLRSSDPKYPSADELSWAEGLLRALALVTEAQIDSGRWDVTVATFDGEKTYQLSLPLLLKELAGLPASDQGAPPAEAAVTLVDAARSRRGRGELIQLRRALTIDPDCVPALLRMAERTSDDAAAVALLERAVAAAARRLGDEVFRDHVGHFWLLADTRPYMHARHVLAYHLLRADRMAEAADNLLDLLRLSPNDAQGNRYLLARAFLQADDLQSLAELLDRPLYADDASAAWKFSRVLLAYRQSGDSDAAQTALHAAANANPHVIPLLIGRELLPMRRPPFMGMGDESEAAYYISSDGVEWDATEGAIAWLTMWDRTARKTLKKSTADKKPKAVKKSVKKSTKRPKPDQ